MGPFTFKNTRFRILDEFVKHLGDFFVESQKIQNLVEQGGVQNQHKNFLEYNSTKNVFELTKENLTKNTTLWLCFILKPCHPPKIKQMWNVINLTQLHDGLKAVNTPSVKRQASDWIPLDPLCTGWCLGMGLGPILERHNVFQWKPERYHCSWCSVWVNLDSFSCVLGF